MQPIPGFEQDSFDARPLPLIVAEKWGFKLAHVEGDGEMWYAVQDWIVGLTSCDMTKASRLWSDMQRHHAESYDSIVTLPYLAGDGKTYQRDYTTDKGLYTLAARLRATKDRPVLAEIKDFLAKAGVFVDAIRRDPEKAFEAGAEVYRRQGKDEKWIEERLEGKISRERFMRALQTAVAETLTQKHYAIATNDLYLGLWARTAEQLKSEMGLSKRENLRDHQPRIALLYQRVAEEACAIKLGSRQMLSVEEARAIVYTVAQMIGAQAKQTGEMLGIDAATGKPLLTAG